MQELGHPTVQKNHSFFWDTDLSPERMKEISDWIGNLSPEDRQKLRDLLRDQERETSSCSNPN